MNTNYDISELGDILRAIERVLYFNGVYKLYFMFCQVRVNNVDQSLARATFFMTSPQISFHILLCIEVFLMSKMC